MQKLLTLILTVLFFKATNAQTALIKDPDGYCNVRQNANSKSKVIDTLLNDRIIFVFSDAAEGEWLPVDYYKGNRNSSDQSLSGFIHKSRITFLTDLTKFKEVTLNDSTLKLQLDSLQLTMTKVNFNRKGKQLKYDKPQGEQTFLKSIDNKFPWGTDGNIPKKEYKSVQFKTGSNSLNFPINMFKDLFEPNLDMTMAYFDKATGKVYIEAINSDGAGGYVVIWTIKDKRIIGRVTFIPF